jgi:Na+/H+-dicarboxylate symporter
VLGETLAKLNRLSRNIIVSLILGTLVGIFLPGISPYVSWMGLAFKLSLQMIVMPIVLTSILCGLESVGDVRMLRGLGKRAVLYFFSTTIIAIMVGLVLVTTLKPGIRSPSVEIVQAINGIKGSSKTEVCEKIHHALTVLGKFSDTKERTASIINHINLIASKTDTVDELKKATLHYLGALELRSKLMKDTSVAVMPPLSFQGFVEEQLHNALINPFEALAKQQVLAVIIFTLLFGAAMTTIGPLGMRFFEMNRAINQAITKLIDLIMKAAPFGVFGLLVSVISATGPTVFRELSLYALCVILGLMFHLFIVLPGLNYFFTKQRPFDFLKKLRPALVVAFSTSSSNATLPITMQTMEENFNIDKRVSRFILPLGATVNMDGTALYEAVAAVFIAQLYGVTLGLSSQIIIAITAAFAAIGTAGIPAAGTVTMALILSAVGLPIEGVGLLFALDRPLDMCRTVVNVAGDAAGCTILNNYFKNETPEKPSENYSSLQVPAP